MRDAETGTDPQGIARDAAFNAAYGGTLTIHLNAIADNYRLICTETKAEVAACAKADGYGLGLVQVAPALATAGCKTFFVATVEEGGLLRSVLPDTTIYVLNGLFSGSETIFASENLRPCLSSLAEVQEWSAYCAAEGARAAALHGDTGIHRLGFALDDAETVAQLATRFKVTLLMSHLACADDPSSPLNNIQQDRFEKLRGFFPNVPASLANTSGIYLAPNFHYDLVRPGIGLYGGNPYGTALDADGNPHFKPVVTVAARIMQVSHIEPGESVGYGATFVAKRPTRVATLAAGYADGYFRRLGTPGGEGTSVHINGQAAPVIGRVSMDMISVDVTDLPEEAVKRGEFAELIGPDLSAGELGRAAGTFGYEVLTRLGYRYKRTYTSGNGISSG